MRLKIVSDGTTYSTSVVDADSGDTLWDLQAVTWTCRLGPDGEHRFATAVIEVDNVPVEVIGLDRDPLAPIALGPIPSNSGPALADIIATNAVPIAELLESSAVPATNVYITNADAVAVVVNEAA